ncbi:MAG: iron ABC transporter permease [Betaproteobacteria bacterium RIFCSPLOWO2_02_FULL_67_26]|nr:MAG: iron ABC transporter permease [Betaproteobacteria bacterium RIFCSPLOWO2_02_FULL_67_26]
MRRRGWNAVSAAAAVAASVLAVPMLVVLSSVLTPSGETWTHLAATVLPEYIQNTLWLMLGVGIGVTAIGVATAWLTTMCRFPGRGFFEWALILPLAVPAYVMAYAYTDFLQFTGPVQTGLRGYFGWGPRDYWFPDVRSLGGAGVIFSFVFYPYVYLLARAAFMEQAAGMIEAGRSLGYGPWGSFFRLALPLARPGVAAGVALALMETLADFGTVAYFALPTFTTGIYRAWLSLGDRAAAAQLAAALLGFVALVLIAERVSRGRARFDDRSVRRRLVPQRLHGLPALGAIFACVLPLVVGFALPTAVLLNLSISGGDLHFGARYFRLVANSVSVSALTAACAVGLALLMAYAARTGGNIVAMAAHRLAALGYAVPGAVIAVGVLIPVTRLDHALSGWLHAWFGISTGLILTGSIAALVYAYLVRFLAVALQSVEAGLTKVTPSMDDAARGLGATPLATLTRVHIPLLMPSVLTAVLMVFVDVMKELPATFMMRPFNFDTLAVHAYNLASDERLSELAVPALTIVAVGVVPLVVLSRSLIRARVAAEQR